MQEKVSSIGTKMSELTTSLAGWITILAGWFIGLSSEGRGLFALAFFFVLDFITGTCASYVEFRKNKAQAKVYFIESSKLRMSVAKAVAYFLFIIGSWVLQILYFNQTFSIPYSSHDHSVMNIVIGTCIAIEIWSNIENAKRLGFDIVAKIKNVIKKFFELKNLVKK